MFLCPLHPQRHGEDGLNSNGNKIVLSVYDIEDQMGVQFNRTEAVIILITKATLYSIVKKIARTETSERQKQS